MTMEPIWRDSLLKAAERDMETRARLVREGTLFDGYHPDMEAVHLENATLLAQAFDALGWPDRTRLGDEGAAAAFLILQHAISRPDLQRRGLALMLEAIPRGDASMIDAAYLSDRIAVFEGKPQLYGTQFDWFDGELSPAPMVEPELVEERRAAVGLPPLADVAAMLRRRARDEGDAPPADMDARKVDFEAWARKVGWR
ncbi:MAG: hypothetical protein JNM47_11770 [Hyphomonadaceae bacterium]|nr:hypothetical protein [Hyphomonadaceae bacterium]